MDEIDHISHNVNTLIDNEKILFDNDVNITNYTYTNLKAIESHFDYLSTIMCILAFVWCVIVYMLEKRQLELVDRVTALEERLPEKQPLLDYPDKP